MSILSKHSITLTVALSLLTFGVCAGCTKVADSESSIAASPPAVASAAAKPEKKAPHGGSGSLGAIDANDAMPNSGPANFATNPSVGKGTKPQ